MRAAAWNISSTGATLSWNAVTDTGRTHTTRLFPIFHPAAALYTPATLETLREDFRRLPGLLAMPPAPPAHGAVFEPEPEPAPEPEPQVGGEIDQLGLF